ncbi:hypothetical protein [Membranihabitans marinus]|uniref:hypothetical protein n=1 Tax=Membranihabitans marinus TaxID=1227546 RepID=UPI001F205B42|nr:hypothetical protein [Membranihabitans marinus]
MKRLVFAISFLYFSVLSCTKDQVPPREKCTDAVTYEDIEFLIERSCATSGCHDGSSGYGDYHNFEGMKTDIANGGFEAEVILNGTMPKDDTLSTEEFRLFQCWVDNGYLEE